jgi:hypothetical protein
MLVPGRLERHGQFRALDHARSDPLDVSAVQIQVQTGTLVSVQAAIGPRLVVDFSE